MIRLIRGSSATTEDAPEYWITYADLLVSLLMVFALLLFLTLTKMQNDVAAVRRTITANKRALQLAADSTSIASSGMSFDPKTQTISMNSEVLFGYGSAELRPEAEATARSLALRYFPRLLNDTATASQLQEILVEGHTDTVGTYMWNLDLSQRRAYSVMRAIVENTYGTPYAERLRKLITASGKSETEPIYENGVYSAERSRRIVIRIRFRNEDMLRRLVGDSTRAGQ